MDDQLLSYPCEKDQQNSIQVFCVLFELGLISPKLAPDYFPDLPVCFIKCHKIVKNVKGDVFRCLVLVENS